jgi:putative tryptophan/tyrosine transport system substrate-binding protein
MTGEPMQRRAFITLLGGAAAAWPIAARTQQAGRMPVIGILGSSTVAGYAARMPSFMLGLKEIGFVEGQNVVIEYRWADDQNDRLPEIAADLVRARASLIVTLGNNLAARAATTATTTIPVVFFMGADPVQMGFVASLNRPGGNITGVAVLVGDQIQKRLQLLRDVSSAKVFGLLLNPDNSGPTSSAGRTNLELTQDTVRVWGGAVEVAYARTVEDFDAAFASLAERRIEALVTSADTLFNSGRERLIALAARYAIPTIYSSPESTRAGGLLSYNANLADAFRQVGRYAGRILKGEKPADLPVLLPTKFEFVINLKTAKTLGLTINPGLLAIVDEVIE